MSDHLFVYGTLRLALAPSELKPLVESLKPIGKATVIGRLYDLGAYPGATLEASGVIVGAVVELPIDAAVLAALDDYEGYDPADEAQSLFVRRRCRASLLDGRTIECWIYLYPQSLHAARWIPSGDYADAGRYAV